MATENDLLKPAEVAKMLNVSRRKVYYMIDSGELPAVSLGPKTTRIRREDLRALLAASHRELGR